MDDDLPKLNGRGNRHCKRRLHRACITAVLAALLVCYVLFGLSAPSVGSPPVKAGQPHNTLHYETVPGFFAQSSESTNESSFDWVGGISNFSLKLPC